MLILIHIIIALSGIIASSYAYLSPSKSKLKLTYGLTAGTLVSGSYLVVSTSSGILSACVSGLVYLSIVSLGIIGANYKLAHQKLN